MKQEESTAFTASIILSTSSMANHVELDLGTENARIKNSEQTVPCAEKCLLTPCRTCPSLHVLNCGW